MGGHGESYAAAGVSLTVADAVVERLRAAVESTGATGFGAFAGLHPLDERRFLAASTDGVGTKLILARARGRLRDCGADLAAHCINDVLTTGATPLILLDYVAAAEIHLDEVAELVEGAAEVCRTAGVALVGGETAELPGIYRPGELDFAGTCVGIVDRDDLVDGSAVEAGDAVIGFASAGVHANGFTLVRRVLGARALRRARPPRADPAVPRRGAGAAGPREGLRARHGRRHSRQPLTRRPGGAARRARLGRLGTAARVRVARAATSPRTSCGGCSISESAGARSFAT